MLITSVLVFVLVLSVLILGHEFGHYIIAKRNGVWVEEFGIGLPPRIFGKKIGETIYSINALPFGGFCRLHGESSEDGISEPKRAFLNKTKWQRTKIIIAGVIMNFLLAIFAFTIVYSFSGIPKETQNVKIVDVTVSTPAQVAGLIVGDIVRQVNKEQVSSVDSFIDLIDANKGKKVILTIDRTVNEETQTKKISITPRENPPSEEGPLGVVISNVETFYPPLLLRPFYGIYYGFKEALYWGKTVIVGFWQVITQLFSGKVPQDLSGPVGIFAVTSQAAQFGILSIINFIGILSLNLAILNIIPFPALDGGRLLFIGIEAILGKKVLPKVEAVIHTIGMAILLLLLLAITARDITRLIKAGSLSNFINTFQ
jgi:regulator of sigma E protease